MENSIKEILHKDKIWIKVKNYIYLILFFMILLCILLCILLIVTIKLYILNVNKLI
jgi:hypothetical protein